MDGALAFHYHWTSFTSKSSRQKAFVCYLVLGLSGLSGADVSFPKAIMRREQEYLEFLDSGKDDECQVAGMGKQLLYCHVCIWSFGILGKIKAYALEKL